MSTKFALVLVFICLVWHGANGICFNDNSSGLPLPPVIDSVTGQIKCADGFYCPNLDPSNASTYPVYCPPSEKCLERRLASEFCDESQGEFEPRLVPEGYFSANGTAIERCPAGYFCPRGSKTPRKCPMLTACPAGSAKKYNYGVFIFLVLSYLLLLLIVKVYRAKFAFSKLFHETEDGAAIVESGGNTPLSFSATNSSSSFTHGSDATSSEGSPKNRSKLVQILCNGFRKRRKEIKPLSFKFQNLRVSVDLAEGGKKLHLLNNVSGEFAAGKVTAIMGPSGSGKTTLMNALLGKLGANFVRSGELSINGDSHVSRYRHMIGFVPQDDILHQELSVYKNLYYSSEIRLPREWSSKHRKLFRSAVVDILGLTASRDTPIGDAMSRGVSGGQRKRASIGLELVAAPLAMLLDEPTSGLDSFASMELVLLLREIALQTHLCVAMVIHQPRMEIWNTLDEVLILAPGGYTVYQGSQFEAKKYFEEKCGVVFHHEANPADVIMDAVAANPQKLIEQWVEETGLDCASPDKSTTVAVASEEDVADWPGAGHLQQIFLCHNRAVEKQLSVMQPFIVEMVVGALCGLILGNSLQEFEHNSVYRDPYKLISLTPLDALLPQMNLYALMSLSLAGATAGVRVLGENMENYYRETAAGHSRVAYFLGSIWAASYRMIITTFTFCCFYHVLPGFGFSFTEFYGLYVCAYFSMYAVAAPVSVIASKRNQPLIASLLGILCAIFNGFVAYPLWLKRLSFAFWISQYIHKMHDELISTAMEPSYPAWGYEDFALWKTVVIMLSWGVILYLLSLALLVRLNRERQR